MNKLFSIIIPFYNAEKFLKKTITSITNQKRDNIEIVLVNDNSNDNSDKICKNFSKKFRYIKIIKNNKNVGVGKSRNVGIRNSLGKYLIFLDSDDFLHKNSLINLQKKIYFKSEPDLIVLKHKKSTNPKDNSKLLQSINYKKKDPIKLMKYIISSDVPFADCWFFTIKSSLIKKNKILFPETRFGESEFFVVKTISSIKNYECLDNTFYMKNDRINSLNSSNNFDASISVIQNIIKFYEFLSSKKIDKLRKIFTFKYINNNFGLLASLLVSRNKKDLEKISVFLQKKIALLKKINKMTTKSDFFQNVIDHGARKGLKLYLINITKKQIAKINQLKEFKNNLYFYCNSKYSFATNIIAKKNGFRIKGIIDDSKVFRKDRSFNLKTFNLSNFIRKKKVDLTKVGIIIVHQKPYISQRIYKNLLTKGFKKKQIIIIQY